MSAPDVNGSFKNAGIGALMLLAAAFAPANDVHAQQPVQIAQSVEFKVDPARGDNIVSRASDYSRGREVVGIAVSAGEDIPSHITLQQVGEVAQKELAKYGVKAEYFVHKNPIPGKGTSVLYLIDGTSWSDRGMSYREGINQSKAIATDALNTFSYNKIKNIASAPQATLGN